MMASYQMGPLFNPPIHDTNDEGLLGSAMCPGDGGGAQHLCTTDGRSRHRLFVCRLGQQLQLAVCYSR